MRRLRLRAQGRSARGTRRRRVRDRAHGGSHRPSAGGRSVNARAASLPAPCRRATVAASAHAFARRKPRERLAQRRQHDQKFLFAESDDAAIEPAATRVRPTRRRPRARARKQARSRKSPSAVALRHRARGVADLVLPDPRAAPAKAARTAAPRRRRHVGVAAAPLQQRASAAAAAIASTRAHVVARQRVRCSAPRRCRPRSPARSRPLSAFEQPRHAREQRGRQRREATRERVRPRGPVPRARQATCQAERARALAVIVAALEHGLQHVARECTSSQIHKACAHRVDGAVDQPRRLIDRGQTFGQPMPRGGQKIRPHAPDSTSSAAAASLRLRRRRSR